MSINQLFVHSKPRKYNFQHLLNALSIHQHSNHNNTFTETLTTKVSKYPLAKHSYQTFQLSHLPFEVIPLVDDRLKRGKTSLINNIDVHSRRLYIHKCVCMSVYIPSWCFYLLRGQGARLKAGPALTYPRGSSGLPYSLIITTFPLEVRKTVSLYLIWNVERTEWRAAFDVIFETVFLGDVALCIILWICWWLGVVSKLY